ncbi:D-alanyl-D-alanine carboxypeptidase/D-alanyl-D-alanine-endopeptidase [Rhodobacterales bacterium HTCC2150]|nr:D-alanyl-D-alanine carboxypeptidase/D-alanyl-D-alanine-endopeptidase [Rhodobacterales bacterium HTCC2150] [Rhodobacteraceae bacterium HTCC2150]
MSGNKNRISRRFFLAGFFGSTAMPVLAGPPDASLFPKPRPTDLAEKSRPGLADIVAKTGLTGKVSCVVADARTGKVLEVLNPVLQLPPASVAKAITALYAWENLGPGHRFSTRVLSEGQTNNGVVQGDIMLVGGGDPTLDTDGLFDMAAKMKKGGVRGLSGKFKVYADSIPEIFQIDKDQPKHVGYNPAIAALNLNFNRVYFEWKRNGSGHSVTMDARGRNHRPAVSFAKMTIKNRKLPTYTYKDQGGRDQWTVASGALGKGGGRWLPVRRPVVYTAEVFRTFARSHGIDLPKPEYINGPAPIGGVLVERPSADLRNIMTGMLRYSTNLTAEIVGLAATQASGGKAGSLRASANEMSAWMQRRLGNKRAKLEDHSGLGDGSRISAHDMVNVLRSSGTDGPLINIMKEYGIRDAKGRPLANQPADVVAKTGTLNFVSALAGYIRQKDGRILTFAIFTADMKARDRIAKGDEERPKGSRSWSRKSRALQNELVKRWAETQG